MSNITSNKKAAGAFDVRNIIGALLGIYGIVLLIAAFLLDPGMNPDTGLPKDASYNTWTGLALVASAAVFLIWAKVRPIIVPADAEAPAAAHDDPHHRDAVKEA
ncbi:cell wall anchor protein [Corynebacterium sp. NPDC060344]|uniref:cell wall anchor protein n=1 Tax=Corynebacterium sp. NPDC060344 TaxID=3347101 RepID=UPI003646A389